MAGIWKDVRYSTRLFARQPGFALLAVFTLALGIGAVTAIYSVMMTVLVQPLPYRDAERLVWLSNVNPSLGGSSTFLNPEDILDYQEQARSFEQVASWGTNPVNLSGGNKPERVESIYVTPNFFRTLGIAPLLGRDFAPEEGKEGSHVAIISYGLWQRQFGGDPAVIGRKVQVSGNTQTPPPLTIIGVMPAEMNFPVRVDLFDTYQHERGFGRGGSHNDRTIARLKPGVTIAQAQAEISAIAARQALQFPETNKGWDVQVVPFREHLFGSANTAIPLLFGAALFVLLIAWTNVANLQLVRAAARQKEIAVRVALGASRWQIVRQLLTESLLLAGGGALLGTLLALAGIKAVRALGPASLMRLQDVTLDARALVFTLVISLLTGIAFGLVPALQVSKPDLNSTLKEGGRDASVQPRRFHRAFVVAQFALALMLLSGAGLLLRSFWKLQQTSPGFQSEQILAAGASLNKQDYNPPRMIQFYQQEVERLSQLPGVESAAAISHLPFGGRTMQLNFKLEGQATTSGKNLPLADYRVITPSLLETLRIPLQQGRALTEQDTTETPIVYLVNEAFARTYSPHRSIIGQRLLIGYEGEWPGEIVGVIGDIKHRSAETEAFPTMYISYRQCLTQPRFPIMHFLVRTRLNPETLTASMRDELSAADANQVIFYVRPLEGFVADARAQRKFSMLLLALFALLALLLAALGVYGVMSYAVTRRTRELGVRLALGAQPRDVLQLIISEGFRMTLLGVVFGLAGSFVIARILAGLLFGIGATDALTFVGVTLLLLALALLACWLPARRATKIDPMIALRCD